MTEKTVDLGIDGLTNIEVIGAGGTAIVYRADRVRAESGDVDPEVTQIPELVEVSDDEDGAVNSATVDTEAEATADAETEAEADPDTVAIKVLRLSWDPAALRRFEREQRVMSRLSQMSGFVSILETGEAADGSPYIVMPYYAGGSLQDRMRDNGPMAWPRAVRLIEQVALTLAEAHRRDVYHRDVKPANILLSESGQAHVADFGISLIADENLGRSTVAAFTPAYSPPESFSDGLQPVASTDVYGLAATLWALLAGHGPFKEKDENVTTATVFGRVATQQIGDLRSRVPSPICHFIERAVAKMPEERPASMAAFLTQLREAREDAYRGLERPRFVHKPLEIPHDPPAMAKAPLINSEDATLMTGPLATSTVGDSRGPDLVILGAGVGRTAHDPNERVSATVAPPQPGGQVAGRPSAVDSRREAYRTADHDRQSYRAGDGFDPVEPTSALSAILTALAAALVTSAIVLAIWYLGSRLLG